MMVMATLDPYAPKPGTEITVYAETGTFEMDCNLECSHTVHQYERQILTPTDRSVDREIGYQTVVACRIWVDGRGRDYLCVPPVDFGPVSYRRTEDGVWFGTSVTHPAVDEDDERIPRA
jgi:hypothetical protein